MKIIAKTGKDEIATVYLGETESGHLIEFVESVQPPHPLNKKWVITVSTLYGCPVQCRFCDAGFQYLGKLTENEILQQIDHIVRKRFSDGVVPVTKFKIQFSRMGEPSFNSNVLSVLDQLPQLYDSPGLIPSFSTVAPNGTDLFFKKLLDIKKRHYQGRFQFQFSIHTSNERLRQWLIPVKTWSFDKMAEFGKRLYEKGDRKITLNFVHSDDIPVEPAILLKNFSPEIFLIKITPVNPTHQAVRNNISSVISPKKLTDTVNKFQNSGYEVLVCIGELEENYIGSNCGQYITAFKNSKKHLDGGYTYQFKRM